MTFNEAMREAERIAEEGKALASHPDLKWPSATGYLISKLAIELHERARTAEKLAAAREGK